MALVEHAEQELNFLLGEPTDYPVQEAMRRNILEMVRLFCAEEYSGLSASYVINILERILRFEPLTPLTGEDNEWHEVEKGKLWQNKRCSRVFKEIGIGAYDSEGKVFKEDGSYWIRAESRVFIDFPYTPKKEYVDR